MLPSLFPSPAASAFPWLVGKLAGGNICHNTAVSDDLINMPVWFGNINFRHAVMIRIQTGHAAKPASACCSQVRGYPGSGFEFIDMIIRRGAIDFPGLVPIRVCQQQAIKTAPLTPGPALGMGYLLQP